MRRIAAALAVIVLGAVVLADGPLAAASPNDGPSGVSWQSAGDSYSSGEGVSGNRGACAQSDLAYGPQAASRLSDRGWGITSTTFTACTGHLVEDYFNRRADADGKGSLWDWGREQGGPERVDVLAMSFGGNDVGFGDVVTECLVSRCGVPLDQLKQRADWLLEPGRRNCQQSRRAGKEYDCDLALSSRRGSIVDFYTQLVNDRLTARGRLFVMGYPRLFAPTTQWPWWEGSRCAGVAKSDTAMLGAAAEHLNDQLIEAVRRANDSLGSQRVVFVDRLAAYRDGQHELCGSGEDWLNGVAVNRGGPGIRLRYETSFHPNAAGHSGVADELVARAVATFPADRAAEPVPPSISDTHVLAVEFVRRMLQGGDVSTLARGDAIDGFAESLRSEGADLPRGSDADVSIGEGYGYLLTDLGGDGGSCSLFGDISGGCIVSVRRAAGSGSPRFVRVNWSLLRDGDGLTYSDGEIYGGDGSPAAPDRLRPEVIGAEVLPEGVEANQSGAWADSLTFFNSPSGNISCEMDIESVRCDIRNRTWQPPSTTCPFGTDTDGQPITLDYGNGLEVGASGAPGFTCAGDTVLGEHPLLNYGESRTVGRFRCTSLESGISCERLGDGRGFLISKGNFEFR